MRLGRRIIGKVTYIITLGDQLHKQNSSENGTWGIRKKRTRLQLWHDSDTNTNIWNAKAGFVSNTVNEKKVWHWNSSVGLIKRWSMLNDESLFHTWTQSAGHGLKIAFKHRTDYRDFVLTTVSTLIFAILHIEHKYSLA